MSDTATSHRGKPDLRWDALTPTIITTALATAVVALRLVVRIKFVKACGFDDLVIVISLVSFIPSDLHGSKIAIASSRGLSFVLSQDQHSSTASTC